jgi:GT2 family glycosyltransferase
MQCAAQLFFTATGYMFSSLLAGLTATQMLPFVVKNLDHQSTAKIQKGRVSIVIPAYNRLIYLQKAVTAALNQTYPDIEIIISQNPRPEGLNLAIREWAEEQASMNPRIKYYFNNKNLGISGNYKACLERVTGEYTTIIGDDDIQLPDCVEKYMAGAAHGADVIFCNRYLINEYGQRIREEHVRLEDGSFLTAGPVKDCERVAWLNLIMLTGAAVRTEKLLQIGFDPDNNLEDYALFVKLAATGASFYFIDQLLVEFRVHSNSLTGAGKGTFHHLLRHIIPIQVSAENEILKGKFISPLMIPAVNLCLREGNQRLAEYLLSSRYYPRKGWKALVWLVQRAMLTYPNVIAPAVFSLYYHKRSKI